MHSNPLTISFDDVFKTLNFALNNIKKNTESITADIIISRLKIICVGSDKPYKPLYVPDEYVTQWEDYLSTNREPEVRAVRYLCWKPDIASDTKFIDYLYRGQMNLSARSLQGIVRACHFRWESVLKESLFKKVNLMERVRGMIVNYKGPNRILQKWNSSIDIILSSNGPGLFATEMLRDFRTIKEHTESWAVEIQSDFFLASMKHAVQQCKHDLNRCRYLFAELLRWTLWSNTEFKKMISDLILDDYFNDDVSREMLQIFILSDDRLGDPRLPRNNRNWLDMSSEARSHFIQWLSQVDIVFFFDHVLPKGDDPHGRKDFWLKYLKQFRATRPMLYSGDENRLRSVLLRNRSQVGHFGKIYSVSDNSVFLLDFGSIITIEFSKVGACYIYNTSDFRRIYPDFWHPRHVYESIFRNRKKCIGRIIHDRGGRWKREMSNLLSQYGIRAG